MPERTMMYTSRREEEEIAQMCPSGKATEHNSQVGEYEIYKEERDLLEEMRKIDECDMENFGTQDCSHKTIAILGDRWWPQTVKQERDKMSKKYNSYITYGKT